MRSQHARAVHHQALTIMCPECHAAPGDSCFRKDSAGNKVVLKGPPAHWSRSTKAMKARELPFDEEANQ